MAELEQVNTEEMVAELVGSAEAHSAITKSFMNGFTFQGHSLEHWLNDVCVEIPKNITPENFRETCTVLSRKLQKASYFYTIANTMFNGLQSSGEIKKSDLVAAIVQNYANQPGARRPAAASIERMAESYLGDTANNKIAARILRDFWRDRRDALIEVRKTLEMIGISMSVEMKYHET